MESAYVLIIVGGLVFMAHLFVSLFDRTRIPDVLFLILIGVVIGPILHIATPKDFGGVGHIFTTIALAVILFEGGLELKIEHLTSALRGALVLTVVSYLLTFVAVSGILVVLLQVPVLLSVFVGAVLAAPAPAIMIPMAQQLRLAPPKRTALTLEAPIGEALGIILSLAILDSIVHQSFSVGVMIGRILSSFSFAVVFGVVAGYAWSVLLARIRQLRNAIFTTPSFILVLFGVTEMLGFSGPVAALTFGITLGNVEVFDFLGIAQKFKVTPLQHNETERAFFGEIVFVIKTFFFVYLGLSLQLTDYWALNLAFALSGVILLTRLVAVRAIASKTTTVRDALLMGVMTPKGTAAAVLGAIPLQMQLPGGAFIQNMTYAVIVVSITVTSILIFLIDRTPFARLIGMVFNGYGAGGPAKPGTPAKGVQVAAVPVDIDRASGKLTTTVAE